MLPKHGCFRTYYCFKTFTPLLNPLRNVRVIDKSKVPTLNENDLEEHFIRGGGPGGQKVNKGRNCVFLLHKPTGIGVKVHESRDQGQNRKLAREKIISKLDNLVNKESSIENQTKYVLQEKSIRKTQKQKKLNEMKKKWKQLLSEYFEK